MKSKHALGVLLTATLVGCAYPGHGGLMQDAHQAHYSFAGDMQSLTDCLTDKFNNEPFGVWDINTPVTTSLQREGGTQLVSSMNSMWWWSIILTPTQRGTDIKADVRKSVNPYLSNTYMLEKVGGYLAQCGAKTVLLIRRGSAS